MEEIIVIIEPIDQDAIVTIEPIIQDVALEVDVVSEDVEVFIDVSVQEVEVLVVPEIHEALVEVAVDMQDIVIEVSEIGLKGDKGLSNYEIAVKNGYTGTEFEWIFSSMSNTPVTHVHDQGIPDSVWTVNHPLNKRPSVTVVDSAGREVTVAVESINNSLLIITINGAMSGKAYLN